jgi:uncharacterized protein YacL
MGPILIEPAIPDHELSWTDRIAYTRWAFYAGLAAGVLILLAAFIGALFLSVMAAMGNQLSAYPQTPVLIGAWGIVTGGAVTLATLRVKERPMHAAMPGVVLVAGGVLSFLALGGFLLGGLLAIVAGVLAIAGSRAVFYARGPRLRAASRTL